MPTSKIKTELSDQRQSITPDLYALINKLSAFAKTNENFLKEGAETIRDKKSSEIDLRLSEELIEKLHHFNSVVLNYAPDECFCDNEIQTCDNTCKF